VYGWRARIGLILPMDNAVIEPEYYGLGLHGVSFHAVRMDTTERTQMPIRGVALSEQFKEVGANAVGYACAETSFLQGVDGNAWIEQQIEARSGLPAVTASGAMVQALAALGVSRVALVAPYPAARTAVMTQFLARQGVAVTRSVSRDFNEGTGEAREWYQTNLQPASVAYQMARAAVDPSAQAVVIAATNFRSLEIIERLEADLGLPVVTSNQAILWSVLRKLGLRDAPAHLGRLFSQA
jgi:maleate isomerase